jgi:trehalose 6-phosphate synthase
MNSNGAKSTPDAEPLIVIASNRGPFTFEKKEDGTFDAQRGSGGLVTALWALAAKHEVVWVAAALSDDDVAWAEAHPDQPAAVQDIQLQLVQPTKKSYDYYYNTISNPLLWFIHHQLWDAPRHPSITQDTWNAWKRGYVKINKLFAEEIAKGIKRMQKGNRQVIVFTQDYHLYLVPKYLREQLGDEVHIQPFIHIPWPGPDAWRVLPAEMLEAILDSLLQSDRIGFQTERDAFNFVQTARFYLEGAHSYGSRDSIHYNDKKVVSKSYPISVDVKKLESLAEERETQLHKSELLNIVGDRKLILRVDRIEPSKNILRGFEAYRALLEMNPEHHGRVQMLALLVPSRMEVDEYSSYLRELMAIAGMINADYSDGFWEPVRILVGNNYHRAIAAMQMYDLLLVNPIADGMNLVAKEGVLVNQRNGVLLLSEKAGAFYELGDYATAVNPYDIYGTAHSMNKALALPELERQRRAEALRKKVRASGVSEWFYGQVDDALSDIKNQSKNSATPETPSTSKSAVSSTSAGESSD